eukprot:Rmarinus@m.27027
MVCAFIDFHFFFFSCCNAYLFEETMSLSLFFLVLFICHLVATSEFLKGGAVAMEGETVFVGFIDTRFEGNLAKAGGAVYCEESYLLVENTTVHNSTCPVCVDSTADSSSSICSCGASVYVVEDCVLHLSDSVLQKNVGGIYAHDASLFVRSSEFVDNTMAQTPGGAAILAISSNVEISDSEFLGMSASGGFGGAVYAKGEAITILNSNFRENKAGKGGAVVVESMNDGDIVISGCCFEKNRGTHLGGALYFETAENMVVLNTEFRNNYAGDAVSRPILRHHGGGGAIACKAGNSRLRIEDCTFERNHALLGLDDVSAGDGGALSMLFDVKLSVVGSTFLDNIADRFGGGIYLGTYGATVISNCTIQGNHAVDGGGIAIFSQVIFENVYVAQNNASNNGGGIAIHSAILNLLLGSQTRVVGNIAQQNGGGISMLSSTIHIQRPEEGYFTCESCSPGSVGNGHCDPECFARACQWDAGDCMTRFANPVPVGGSEVVCECEINNGECDASCFRLECSFDGHDCDDVAHVDIMSCPHFLNNYFKALEASPVQFAEEGGICILPTQVGSLSFDECATGHTLELQWYRYYNCSAVSAEDDVPSWDDYPTDLPPEIWETQCDGGGYLMSYKDAIRNVRNSTVYDSTFLRGKISWTKSFDFSDAVLVRAQGVYTVPEGKGGSYEFAAIASGEIYVYVVPEEDGTFTDVSPEHLLLKPSATSTLSVSPTWDNPTDIVRRFTNLKAGVRYLFVIDMFDVYTTSTFFELGRKYPGDELRYAPSGTEYFSPRDTLDHSDDPWCVTRDLSSDGERETWGTCTDDVFVFSRGNVNMEETWAALETELDELEYMGKCFEAPLILSHNEAASGYGGGLYMGSCTSNDVLCFVNPPYNPPSMTVVFTDNYAFFAGGGMFVQCHEMSTPCIDSMMTLSPVNISSWYFHGNRADGYGFDYASGASTLDVVMGDVILRYFSGDVLQGTFRILDYFKQVIRAPLGDLHPYILRTLLCVGEEGCLSTANLVSVEHHRFAEDGLSRLNESQHVVTFSAEDNVVDPELSLMALVVNEDLVESLTFPISREACPAGTQKLLSSTPLGRQSELCITCEYSTYSFIKDSSSCHPCPAGATCPGGWQINADKSYWSPCRNVFDMDTCRHSDGEIELWKCPKEGGCLAGSENVIMECDTAYLEDSRLCSRCRFGYWMFQHQCYRCHSTSLNVFNVVVIVLVLFWLPLARWAAVNFPFLYIALTYFQLLSITSEFNIDWPNRFRTFIQSFSLLNFDISISQAECFLADDQYFLITFLLYMSLPVIYGWLFFGRPQLLRLYAAMTSGGRNIALHSGEGFLQRTMRPATEEEIKEAKGMALHTFLFTVNQLYLSCITKAFQIFLCATFKDNDHYYLVVSPEVECKGDSYFLMFAVAISALFVYLLGVPSLFVWIVGVYGKARRHPSHPDHESFKRRFGFLYARFDPDFYWWEMMTICRKLGFSIFRTFFQYDSLLQTSLCMLLTVAAIMMQYAFRPFVLQRWNVLECATLASVFSVLLLAHMYNYSSTASYSAGTALGEMLGFAAVMTGLGSVFVVGWLDVRAYMQKKIVPIRIPSTSNKNIFSPSQTRQGGVWTTKGGCKTDRKASRYLASTAEDSTCID